MKKTIFTICTATAQKNISFINFCILTKERGIGSKKNHKRLFTPTQKSRSLLPSFFHSHMYALSAFLFHTYSHRQELFYKFVNKITNKLVKQLLSMTVVSVGNSEHKITFL